MKKHLGLLSYSEALREQAFLSSEGRTGWLFFACKPVITISRRASVEGDLKAPLEQIQKLDVEILAVDRGGQATFHGPGQILGFPVGTLERHGFESRGVRDFVCGLEKKLARFVSGETGSEVSCSKDGEGAGVWIVDAKGLRRKIASLGLGFSRLGIRHGFALNVYPMPALEELVHPCGARDTAPQASILSEPSPQNEARLLARLSNCF